MSVLILIRSRNTGIAQNLIDANGVVLAIVLKVNGFPPTQKVLLEAAVQLFVMCGRETNQERDFDGIQSLRNIPILQFLRNRKEGQNEETVILGFITQVRDAPLRQRIVLPIPADVVRFESLKPVRHNQAGSENSVRRFDGFIAVIDRNNHM